MEKIKQGCEFQKQAALRIYIFISSIFKSPRGFHIFWRKVCCQDNQSHVQSKAFLAVVQKQPWNRYKNWAPKCGQTNFVCNLALKSWLLSDKYFWCLNFLVPLANYESLAFRYLIIFLCGWIPNHLSKHVVFSCCFFNKSFLPIGWTVNFLN